MNTKFKIRSRKSKRKPVVVVKTQKIPGLAGLGLIRVGSESRLQLRDQLNMQRIVFSRMVNVSERTLAKIEANAERIKKLNRAYNEVFRLTEALSEVVDEDAIGGWMQTPNEAFGGLKPMEVIERGEIDRLWDMVFRLRSGMPG